uniref:Si:dkeyp-69b9.3 n=1 Tax=Nothobranchius furzeri TaxID=105023 RepID=A0A8C6MH30_NOTFU
MKIKRCAAFKEMHFLEIFIHRSDIVMKVRLCAPAWIRLTAGVQLQSLTEVFNLTGRPHLCFYLKNINTTLLQACEHAVCLQTARPPSPACSSSLPPPLNFNHLAHSRKPRDIKPKMRKLKYHQYIPPDQRGPLDPAYSHLLTQQQVFLQFQIMQSQQQQQLPPQPPLPAVSKYANYHNDLVKSSRAAPPSLPPAADMSPAPKPELLPANLVDLTVSELRQQLRKRGLPVSGTKPALLQRLRPFQLPHACPAPAPISDPSCSLLQPNQISLAGEQCHLTGTVFMAPASTASGTPSPSLPMSSSSPLQCGTLWKVENEQLQQQELSMGLQMRGRRRSRPSSMYISNQVRTDQSLTFKSFCCGASLLLLGTCFHCRLSTNFPVLSNHAVCCQPCDVIGRDFELPLQITASPVQTSPGIRSLEEELQEAIQKAQVSLQPSIDDILNEPITSEGESRTMHRGFIFNSSLNVSDHKSPAHSAPKPPSPQTQPSLQQHDDNFLPSPLCSSLLLELPPSPAVINPSQVVPAPPPPPPICISPPPSTRKSRKRRAPTLFDAADWLETLTSGIYPLTPPKAPFVETDFSLDSDLNVNRVLDLLIEQW